MNPELVRLLRRIRRCERALDHYERQLTRETELHAIKYYSGRISEVRCSLSDCAIALADALDPLGEYQHSEME